MAGTRGDGHDGSRGLRERERALNSDRPSATEIAIAVERWMVTAERRGEARGLRAGILRILEARSLTLGDLGQARLESCDDIAILTRWLDRATTATSEVEVFAGGNAGEQLFAEGFARGFVESAEVLRTSITTILEARALARTDAGRARLANADVATLTRWLTRAATATSEADVFASANGTGAEST